jgi:hypothetical protein
MCHVFFFYRNFLPFTYKIDMYLLAYKNYTYMLLNSMRFLHAFLIALIKNNHNNKKHVLLTCLKDTCQSYM